MEKDGRARGYAICATKSIKAPAGPVYDAFATSAGLSRWMGPLAEVQGGEGGTWHDGDGHRATVTKLSPGKAVRLAWNPSDPAKASLVDLKLTEKAGVTGIVLNHERIQARGEADGLRAAWGSALGVLKALLEGA